jgi:signal transduction histidine kinase
MIKLLAKSTIYNIIVTIVLFTLGAFAIYKTIIVKFESEANEHLISKKNKTIQDLKNGIPSDYIFARADTKNQIKEVAKQTIFTDKYSIVTEKELCVNNEEEEEEEEFEDEIISFKILTFQTKIKNKIYEIKVANSLSEGKEVGEYIMGVVIVFLIASTVILLLLNVLISKYIWMPFNFTINLLKKWEIKQPLQLNKSNIYEFNILNNSLIELTEKIKLDYLNLKEFTENISHETQTPLTILSNKLELLLQENNYTPNQSNLIRESYQAVQRLYKLNKTLILLSRIDNRQFLDVEHININEYVNAKVNEYEDFFESKNTNIQTTFKQTIFIDINPVLANVFLDNLFLNAIKYNLDNNGVIDLRIENNSLLIQNTSFIKELEHKHLFERISKNSTSNSLGIGLSLIKKIVDVYGWKIEYSYKNEKHQFLIYFK